MKKTKVLQISGITVGGVGTVLKLLTRKMNKKFFKPVLLLTTPLSSGPHDTDYLAGIETVTLVNGPDASPPPLTLKIDNRSGGISALIERKWGTAAAQLYYFIKQIITFMKQDLPKIPRMVKAMRKHAIDIIHTHRDIPHSKAEIIAAKLTGTPIVVHVHGFPELWLFDRLFARLVDAFVYISDEVGRHHEKQRRHSQNGVVIHNGIDVSVFEKNVDPGFLRSKYNLDPSDLLVGMVGRFEPWKGQRYFVEAMKDVIDAHPNAKAFLIGGFNLDTGPQPGSIEFDYYQSLLRIIRHYDLNDKFIFTGYLNNVPDVIASLDIVVHASCTPEPFGLVIIEAMAAGKPVVATDAGGVPDIIQDGKNGILVPMRDATAMAGAIRQLAESPEWAMKMGAAAKRRIADQFTIGRQIAAVQALYARLLGRPYHS